MHKSELPQNTLPFAGTIWADIGNRQQFIYAVDSFLSRETVLGVKNMTGAKEETIMKYIRIIKNALREEVEASIDSFNIGGVGVTVQAGESHVFKRKNNVGRILVFTEHGWLFGMVEDTPNGKFSSRWLNSGTKKRCWESSRNASAEGRRSSPTLGGGTWASLIVDLFTSW